MLTYPEHLALWAPWGATMLLEKGVMIMINQYLKSLYCWFKEKAQDIRAWLDQQVPVAGGAEPHLQEKRQQHYQ